MGDWKDRVGGALLSGTEVVLASAGVATVAMLVDIERGVESGAYNREAAAGFTFAFLVVWALAYLGLAALVGGHAVAWATGSSDGSRLDRLVAVLPRLGVELVVAVGLTAAAFGSAVTDVFGSAFLATAAASVAVLVHVAADVGLFAKRLLSSR